jgi:HK97 family phage prohead protease
MKPTDEIRTISSAFDAFGADDVRAIDEASGSVTIRGYAARYNEYSDDLGGFREVIDPGAFDDVLADKQTDVRALINHEGVPLARFRGDREDNTLSIESDGSGLRYSFELDMGDPAARSLALSMQRGDIDQSSFRFRAVGGAKFIERDGGMVRQVSRVTSLRDVSIVTFPAYPTTSAEVKRSLDEALADLQSEPVDELRARAARAAAELAEHLIK